MESSGGTREAGLRRKPTVSFATAVLVASSVFYGLYRLLDVQGIGTTPKLDAKTLFDLVKLSFGVVAGAGALVALVVAYRRQRVDEAGAHREPTKLHPRRSGRRSPTVGSGCKLTGGRWTSYFDGQEVTDAGSLDVAHLVALGEVLESGATAWTAEQREAYANDQGSDVSLVAVTSRTNRQKADKDPADWMPPSPQVQCRYTGNGWRPSSAGNSRRTTASWKR